MADSAYKILDENDKVSTRTLLHEAIPITASIVSGTYGTWPSEVNIKNYSHGMFQSIYDYPYLSSSANHLFDITVGVHSGSTGLYTSVVSQQSKKKNIYNQMAQVLVGYDKTGSIMMFDEDGDFVAGGRKIRAATFLNFSRLLTKDEIKKESFQMVIGADRFADSTNVFTETATITDLSASTEYRVNSPAGEYGILYATGSTNALDYTYIAANHADALLTISSTEKYVKCGLIYYQAGIVVLTSSIFTSDYEGGFLDADDSSTNNLQADWNSTTDSFIEVLTGSEISASADGLRRRIKSIQFNNTTELNSTIYFCRANHNEYNYSANMTYLSASKIRVKNESTDVPVSYITTVGLYNDRRELLAVAKLSEPLKKTPDTEFTLRVRLDY